MRTIPPRLSIPLVMGIVLLLVLAFPSSLYANDLSATQPTLVGPDGQHVVAVVVPNWSKALVRKREHRDQDSLLMDADLRLRAAAALVANPAIEKAAENAPVPLRMIVLTASPLLEV